VNIHSQAICNGTGSNWGFGRCRKGAAHGCQEQERAKSVSELAEYVAGLDPNTGSG
jgi:hypothetical protein